MELEYQHEMYLNLSKDKVNEYVGELEYQHEMYLNALVLLSKDAIVYLNINMRCI